MNKTIKVVTTINGKKRRVFKFRLRKANAPENLFMHAERFYKAHMAPYGFILEYPHHEMEILRGLPKFGIEDEKKINGYHVHFSDKPGKENLRFVCYVRTVSSAKDSEDVLINWCLGVRMFESTGKQINLVAREARDANCSLQEYCNIYHDIIAKIKT